MRSLMLFILLILLLVQLKYHIMGYKELNINFIKSGIKISSIIAVSFFDIAAEGKIKQNTHVSFGDFGKYDDH